MRSRTRSVRGSRRWLPLGLAVLAASLLPLPGSAVAVPGTASAARAPSGPGWGLDRIDQRHLPLDGAYAPARDGSGVTVYLVDSGLDVSSPEFGGRARLGVNLTGTTVVDCADELGVGHGTFVAGIAGGTHTGAAPGASLVEVQALGCAEGGNTMTRKQERRAMLRAVSWVRTHAVRPAVVNMSLRWPRWAKLDRAVRRLVRSGVPVVAAAGNDGIDACRFSPAHLPEVITVAASTKGDRAWSGSNQGRCVDLWAPGGDITSVMAWGGGVIRYREVTATSWATPYVTGAVAQYLQHRPGATPAKVQRWVRRTSTKGVLTKVPAHTPNRLLYVR